MEQLELDAKAREVLGKRVRFMRREGMTPANVFGHEGSHAIEVETPSLRRVLAKAGRTGLIALKVAEDAQPRMVMVRGLQWDPRSGGLLHVDFYQVRMTEQIEAEVPLAFVGDAPAVKGAKGSLLEVMSKVTVAALPGQLPRSIAVDISGLVDADQGIYIKDLVCPEGCTIKGDPELMVAKIEKLRVEEEVAAPKAEVVAEGEAKPEEKAEAEQKTE
ncbi:MAG: 50S ribosomal protein L25 [Chloroflexota bacterium]|nr:50S ribosomal protein L25 [Chloroflexota bacterium]